MAALSSLHVLKTALTRLLSESGGDGGHAEQFRNVIWAFLDALCQHPSGESLLVEHGTFVSRNTAVDTPYAQAWERAKHLGDVPWLQSRTGPQTTLVADVARIRDAVRQALDRDVELKTRYAEVVPEPPPGKDENKADQGIQAESLKDRMECGFTDEATHELDDLWKMACDLAARGENCHADGCYLLLSMHRHKLDCFETRMAPSFADDIKAAAEFLAGAIEATAEMRSAELLEEHIRLSERGISPEDCVSRRTLDDIAEYARTEFGHKPSTRSIQNWKESGSLRMARRGALWDFSRSDLEVLVKPKSGE